MKRILLFVPGFYYGGVESFIINTLRENETSSSCKFIILARYIDKCSFAYNELLKYTEDVYSLDIQHLTPSTYKQYEKKLDDFLRATNIDIAHVNGILEPVIMKVLNKYKIPVILHAHEPKSESDNPIVNNIKKIVACDNIKRANYYLACSKGTLKQAFGKSLSERNSDVLYNGIETDLYKYDSKIGRRYRTELGIRDDEKVIIQVGRISKVKNQRFMIEVLSGLFDIKYKMIFVGGGDEISNLKVIVQQKGISNNVIFLGERGDIPALLQTADLFVMPSIFEGLGIALIEAQAAGLPCIISESIPKEVIVTSHVQSIGIQEKDIDKWRYAIINSNKVDRQIDNFKVANSEYSEKVVLDKLNHIYDVVSKVK